MVHLNCKHCTKEYTPKQLYCSDKCRVYAFRNSNGNVTGDNGSVTGERYITDVDGNVTSDYKSSMKPRKGECMHYLKHCTLCHKGK